MSNESNQAGATALGSDVSRFNRTRFNATWATLAAASPVALPLPPLQVFDSLLSTNQQLWDLLRQGAEPGTAVLALQQEAGRGQWGRQWVSPPGGVYLSLAIAPQIAATQAAQLTLASAWGIAHQFRSLAVPVQLKWPNDLVLLRRKLGGILTETRIHQGQITQAVVGVGINWKNPVPETGICLGAFLADANNEAIASLEAVAAIALYGLLSGFHYWQTAGVPALLAAYNSLFLHLGERVDIEGKPGSIVGITSEGQLRVRLASGTDQPDLASERVLDPGAVRLGYG